MRRPWRAAAMAALCAGALLVPAGAARADDRPPTGRLVLAGVGMAIPTYLVGVAAHEGSHALAGVALGHDLVALSVVPGRHPKNGKFYFGYTQIAGRLSRGEQAAFLVAPKITDAVLLSGYAALVATETLPDNRYGQLALVVLATGLWVDFAKDILPAAEHHDMPRIYSLMGLRSEWARLPMRVLHAAAAAAAGYALYVGYERVFADDAPQPATVAATASGAPPDARVVLPLAGWAF